MKTKTLLAALAVSSLVLAQPAAAATRSYDSLPKSGVQATTTSPDRVGADVGETDDLNSTMTIFVIILLFAGVGGLIAATTGESPPTSP